MQATCFTMKTIIFIFTLICCVHGKQLTIVIRDNITHSCPNVNSDIIDNKSINLDFQMIGTPPGTSSVDEITVISTNGETRTMSFPACYRVQLSFRMKKTLQNPYIESFLQMGTNLPCQSADQEPLGTISNVCTNITQTNWCPKSQHNQLRSMLQAKQTCRFCNMCGSLKAEENSIRKYVTLEKEKECRTDNNFQTLTFKMCTPTKGELRKANDDNEGRLEEYWNYLKQGVLTAVIHVMDRPSQSDSRMKQCQKMCENYEENSSTSVSYRQTLLKSIEALCAPKDIYAACVYHTVKFDVIGDFA